MASIEKRVAQDGSVTYRVKVRMKGFPAQSATFARLTDARKWEQNTEAAIRDGRHFKNSEAKKHTLKELIDKYKTEVLPLKPQSVRIQTLQLDWWKGKIGDYLLSDVTSALISEYRQKLANEPMRVITELVDGKEVKTEVKRSAATINRYMAVLSHVFTIAVKEWEWLEDSPMRKISKLREPRGRTRYLSDEERQKLLQACKDSSNKLLYTAVVLALSTGARRMEVLGLRWKYVDLNRRVITLHETKNGERRLLPLAGHALSLVEELAVKEHKDDDFLFPNKFSNGPLEIKKSWEAALAAAGIEDFRFHDLRHSAASYLAMNGASLAEIAEVLGHKTLQMVKRYAHLSEAHTAGVVAKMNEKIFG